MYTAEEARKRVEEIKLKKIQHEREEKDRQIDAIETSIAPELPGKVAVVRPTIFQLIRNAVEKERYSLVISTEKYFEKGELNSDYLLEQLAYEIVMAQLLSHPYNFKVAPELVQVSDYEVGRDFTAFRYQWKISWEQKSWNT